MDHTEYSVPFATLQIMIEASNHIHTEQYMLRCLKAPPSTMNGGPGPGPKGQALRDDGQGPRFQVVLGQDMV